MKRYAIPLIGVTLVTVVIVGRGQTSNEAQDVAGDLSYSRIYSDADGNSHFGDEKMAFQLVPFSPDMPPVSAGRPSVVTNLVVVSAPVGGVADWHPVPRRQVNIVLSGEVEIEVSDGEKRRFGPGSYILGEDTDGRGHMTRVIGDEPAYFAVIALGEQ